MGGCNACNCCYSYKDVHIKKVDSIIWDGSNTINSKCIKNVLFQHLPYSTFAKDIWFKGFSLNHSLYYWMKSLDILKTSDKLKEKGIGSNINCFFCESNLESYHHLFFQCNFTWRLLQNLIPEGGFFLLSPTLPQVFQLTFTLEHKVLTRAYLLITSILIHFLWRERNARVFANSCYPLLL